MTSPVPGASRIEMKRGEVASDHVRVKLLYCSLLVTVEDHIEKTTEDM